MCWSLQKCLSKPFIKPWKKLYCFSVWIVTQRYWIVWEAWETNTGGYTVSLHNPCLSLFVQQIMSFSTNKAFLTILLISAGYVPCCVKSTVGSLNCINRTEWVVGYLHRRGLMICFTTAVLCWSPVEANTLLLCHCSLRFVHFQLQTKVFKRCSKCCNKWFLTPRWWKNTSSSPSWRKSSFTLDMRPLELLLWIQWVNKPFVIITFGRHDAAVSNVSDPCFFVCVLSRTLGLLRMLCLRNWGRSRSKTSEVAT